VKGATVALHPSVDFIRELKAAGLDLGHHVKRCHDDYLRLADGEGRKLTAFSGSVLDREWREAELAQTGDVVRLSGLVGHAVECRWNDLFCEVVKALAFRVTTPTWVVDTNGILWWGRSLDPQHIFL
jgi:hypothetical protein